MRENLPSHVSLIRPIFPILRCYNYRLTIPSVFSKGTFPEVR